MRSAAAFPLRRNADMAPFKLAPSASGRERHVQQLNSAAGTGRENRYPCA